jgi:O-antigen biosynthesis protein WbqV
MSGVNRGMKVAIHLALVFAAFILAYEIRRGLPLGWWLSNPEASSVFLWSLLYTAVAAAVELVLRNERSSWRFASAREVLKLAIGTGVTAAAFLIIMFLSSRAILLPRSTLVLSWLLSLFALVGVRLAWRLYYDPALALSLFTDRRRGGVPLTLVGDIGQAEAYLRRSATGSDREYSPTAIIALGSSDVGQFIHGVPVVCEAAGLARHFTAVAGDSSARGAVLFLDDPIARFHLTTEDIGRLKSQGFRLLRQASLVELQSDETKTHGLREMKLEEFLSRAPLHIDVGPIAALVAGKRALVTGAGGSIGSEIARQLVALGCSHISLLDHSEFLLFEIHREIERAAQNGGASHRAILCNVRDEARVLEVFMDERPDLVFHAAALKHVTLVENNPCEGALTNVLGTWNVAAAARECAAREMVMISTDKAVDPTNIMGATKRIAEALLPAHADGNTRYCVVRFGNVLGSAGSVVPIFRDQIQRGGPVTVSHPDVERYFMTIPEAVQLVLHATALRSEDENVGLRKFVLEMGEPVKIVDLARQMIELNGDVPGVDVLIEITGLRPGEKLTETLVDENEVSTPCVPGITEIRPLSPEGVIRGLDVSRLAALSRDGDAQAVRQFVESRLSAVRGSSASANPARTGGGTPRRRARSASNDHPKTADATVRGLRIV